MLAGVRLARTETLSLDRCDGRVPASFSVTATIDVPPFSNSAMDGFAVRAADLPGELDVVGEVAAGAGSLPPVGKGEAVRIMTGAPLPPGADTVVPIEDALETGDRVRLPARERGTYVREAGHDTPTGASVQLPEAALEAATVAVLASLGVAEVEVRRRPRVAVLSTGDELATPGGALRPGQIYDANSFGLGVAVRESGGEAIVLPLTADDPALIERRLRDAAASADLVVVSGGVSVGRHDHVRDVLERRGRLDFWRIAVQPGKPLAFGEIDGRPVVGLPGNPVSALVTFELFLRPMLRAMLGLPGDGRIHVLACATESMPKSTERRAYLRVVVARDGDGYRAAPAGGQQSSQLRPLAAANALLVVPEGEPAAELGRAYEAMLIGPPA